MAHLARADSYILDILLINLIAVLRQHHTPAIIETLKVGPGYGHVNASDHDVAFLFGIDHCFVNAFHCGFKINDLAFADAARWRLANAQDFDRAIRPAFPDDNTNFGGANLQADDQIIACHRLLVLPLPLGRSGFGNGRCVGARFRRAMHLLPGNAPESLSKCVAPREARLCR